MARPRVFVSSTYFDLKHIRASLEIFIKSFGYEPILSESGNIPYTPDLPLDESCYREVGNSDMYVLIIGGRYGSEASENRTTDQKGFYDFYESITRREHQAAVDVGVPIYILIERAVYSELQTFRRNRDNQQIKYAHVDSVNVFYFIEEILARPRNNPIEQFDKYADIEGWLKEQWAGYFRELLHQRTSQEQIRSLADQVTSLESQVSILNEVNETLKRYLEEVITKVSPHESSSLIQEETERLEEARRAKIEGLLPNLRTHNYPIVGPPSRTYSNISWAVGDTSKWWSPYREYWPEGMPKNKSFETIMPIFTTIGYEPCDSVDLEPGFEKVAIYQNPDGEITHAARQGESGKWTSKLGNMELIEHDNLDALNGELYGAVTQVLKRPITTVQTA